MSDAPPLSQTLQPTQRVGNFQLTRLIGQGGMGAVWAAQHAVTKKEVALKFLKTPDLDSEKILRRFFREARAVSAVRHPNVVAVHDVITHDGLPVMVMDLLEGEDLGARLERQPKMALRRAAQILVPIIDALRVAHHSGVVHRDLKPDNIVLHRRADGQFEPKLIDFGIAKVDAKVEESTDTNQLTQTGTMMGTPYYMAPEQVFGEKDVDHRADIWSMGVILYECLAGRRPFEGDNFGQLFKAITLSEVPKLSEAAPELPLPVTQAVMAMLVRERAGRVDSLDAILEVLSAERDGDGSLVAPTQPPPSGRAPRTQSALSHTQPPEIPVASRRPLIVGGVLAGVVAIGVGVYALRTPAEPTPAAVAASATVASAPSPEPSESPLEPQVEPVTASPAPSASTAPSRPRAATRPAGKPTTKPTVTATAKPTVTEPKPPDKLPGGVVGKTPF